MRKEIIFRFPSFESIPVFMKEAQVVPYSIIPCQNCLQCDCTDEEIDIAVMKYEATIIGQAELSRYNAQAFLAVN
jgi:hypothetical protein